MVISGSCAHRYLALRLFLLLMVLAAAPSAAQDMAIQLPTSNHALLEGKDSLFYQATAGSHREPWRSGMYGYVRNQRGSGDHPLFLRFHEGVDIKPLYRDQRGVPLDSVCAIDDGRVVHTCVVAGYSNYGKYVVVEHIWHGAPYYSLYAHLNDVWTEVGASVKRGEPIGRLGYTGAGINRTRAHLHLEIGMLLNAHYDAWFEKTHRGELNRNGAFNGHNLIGVDVAALFRAVAESPHITMEEFLMREEPFFQLHLPLAERPDLLNRYPWLAGVPAGTDCRSWNVHFTRAGLPLCIQPSCDSVCAPSVTRLDRGATPCRFLARAPARGADTVPLSPFGREYVEVLTTLPDQPILVAAP